MKNIFLAMIGGVVCLIALGANIRYAGNGYGITTSNLHPEVLAQTNGGTNGTGTHMCDGKPKKGYGLCYELHSVGCIDGITLWPPSITRGDKLRCRLLQPLNGEVSCDSSKERACGGDGTGTASK